MIRVPFLRPLAFHLRLAIADVRFARSRTKRRRDRMDRIAADLRAARAGYLLIAGDSHAEMLGAPDWGGPVVNAGIGSIRTHHYADCIESFADLPPASAAILLIGSNDTLAYYRPARPGNRRRFERAARRIVRRLGTVANVVIVSRIAPVGQALAGFVEPGAVETYSRTLERVCAEEGCRFTDLFAGLRGVPEGSFVREGVRVDAQGMHLADYAPVAEAVRPIVSKRA